MSPIDPDNPPSPPPPGEGAFALPAGELRALLHRAADDFCDQLARLDAEPVWQPAPPDVRARLRAPLARVGAGLEATYEAFKRDVLPYRYGNVHPRFFGWVNGSGLPTGVLADFLAATMNSNVGAFDQSAVYVEEQVLGWLRELFCFPADGDGLLTSGGSMANLLALAAARHAHAPALRERGLHGGPRLTLYGSVETHSSVHKAVELLGLGLTSFRRLPVDEHYRLRLDALDEALRADRAAGCTPFALVANAGTVNTGAIDPLPALVTRAREQGLWLHVDGAFGALAWLAPERRGQLAGLEQADSLAFDLHKWLYLPSDIGCVLVRGKQGLERAFATPAPYLAHLAGGLSALSDGAFKDRGIELTRRFRALKAWFALQVHGLEPFERAIRANLEQARELVALVEREPRLELLAPAPLNVVCFRYRGTGAHELDALNRELLVRLQLGGVAVPSQTVLHGRFALRCALTNHRTRSTDLVRLIEEVLRLGAELEREASPLSVVPPAPLT
ncbi:MAG: aminotransferase class V-fold PLP-dependent enzyme [Planctomycetes bacterium]|nr:aminotransferase class V-fold PLP-dependent enzyme [Planctomycetota bacterium]